MIKAVALDDEPPALEVIKKFCSQAGYIDCVKTFTKADEAARYMNNYPVDLLFLDINMPSISGLKFRQMVSPGTMVIFATAYTEYAVEGFNMDALDYLLKPFSYDRFLKSAERARARHTFIHQHAAQKPENLSLRVDYSLVKIPLAKILYIEGMDDYIRIFMSDQKPVISRMRMKAIEEKLPKQDFVRVHRSYIVPVNKIKSIRNKVISINNQEIPLGVCYEDNFFGMINHV